MAHASMLKEGLSAPVKMDLHLDQCKYVDAYINIFFISY